MKVRELRALLKSSAVGFTLGEDAEVCFYNCEETEGDPYYPILTVDFRTNDGKLCCVLADIET